MRALVMLAVIAVSSACGSSVPMRATYPRVALATLRMRAEHQLGCPQVALVPLAPSVVQANGCDRLLDYDYRGAEEWLRIEPVGRQASREMACPAADLAIEAIGPTTRRVDGCGRRARYDLDCGPACAWSMTVHAGAWADPTRGDEHASEGGAP